MLGGVGTPGWAQDAGQAVEPPAVRFIQPGGVDLVLENSTGHMDLVWAPDVLADRLDGAVVRSLAYELQGSRDAAFAQPVVFYTGPDDRTFLSGLAAGDYFFRVRSVGGEVPGRWSEILAVEVDYVARWQVFLLVGVGLLCLVATVGIIVRGSWRMRNPDTNAF